jgi:DNA-binding response OmpR family regulator
MTITQTATIINVEDREPIRAALTRILRQAGFAVTEAATGSAALHLVAATRPQLVLLDVHLPVVLYK